MIHGKLTLRKVSQTLATQQCEFLEVLQLPKAFGQQHGTTVSPNEGERIDDK